MCCFGCCVQGHPRRLGAGSLQCDESGTGDWAVQQMHGRVVAMGSIVGASGGGWMCAHGGTGADVSGK